MMRTREYLPCPGLDWTKMKPFSFVVESLFGDMHCIIAKVTTIIVSQNRYLLLTALQAFPVSLFLTPAASTSTLLPPSHVIRPWKGSHKSLLLSNGLRMKTEKIRASRQQHPLYSFLICESERLEASPQIIQST